MQTRQLTYAVFGVCLIVFGDLAWAQQQVVDPDFDASVSAPAYGRSGPLVAVDAAHSNFHTADGNYRPFVELLKNDGYRVVSLDRQFDSQALAEVDVLVVANANAQNFTDPAFTEGECDFVRDWVRNGGSLLLIADHAPFGSSAANLASRFGVSMGRGWVFDTVAGNLTTQLSYSIENGLLGAHSILRGRDQSESVSLVRTFTGQSLSVPEGVSVLLRLSSTAREAATTDDLDAEAAAYSNAETDQFGARSVPVASRTQGLAMRFGDGKVVVLGEAAMFSAQVVTLPTDNGPVTFRAGMNVPGNDNRQFALNVLHWLSGALGGD